MKPKTTREQQVALWRILDNHGGWMHKKEILESRIVPNSCLNDRAIRAVCAAQPDHFLSSQRGYKLVKHATSDEIAEAIADLASREKCLRERREALERVEIERQQERMAI